MDENSVEKIRQCQNCNQQNPPNSNYCLQCGHSLRSTNNCPKCQYENNPLVIYCTNCGTVLQQIQSISQSGINPRINNAPYVTGPYYKSRNFIKPNNPAWWKMPVFFIILCIFGLTLVTEFLVIILLAFTVGGSLNIDDTNTLLILDAIIRIINLIIIALAINYFFGFKSFWDPNIDESNLNDTQNIEISRSKFSILRFISFIIVLLAVLLIIDIISFYIITAIKNGLSIAEPIISPYPDIVESADVFFAFSITAVLIAPFHEELLFRGYFQQALERSGTADWIHYFIQGVSFAFIHLPGDILGGASFDFIIIHMISAGLFGIAATWLKKTYKTVLVPMIFHGLSNLVSVTIPFLEQFFLDVSFDFDLVLLIISLLMLAVFLSILTFRYKWKVTRPLFLQDRSFKSKSAFQFIFRVLILILVLTSLQYGFIFLSESAILSYILAISIITIIIFILWGSKVVDTKWKDFFPDKTQETSQINTGNKLL